MPPNVSLGPLDRKRSYVPAVDSYWAVLTKLLLCLVNLTNEIYKSITRFGHALLRPVNKLELADRARTTISCVCYFELSQYVLRHIVFSNGIHYKALVSHWAVTGPILMAFLLEQNQSNWNIVIKSYSSILQILLQYDWDNLNSKKTMSVTNTLTSGRYNSDMNASCLLGRHNLKI